MDATERIVRMILLLSLLLLLADDVRKREREKKMGEGVDELESETMRERRKG